MAKTRKVSNNDLKWMNVILPFNIAAGPVGTLVQLYILDELHGTVLDVGYAITLFNAVGIPSAIIWGFVTDRFHKRKPLITLSYALCGFVILSFYFAKDIHSVSLLYASFSFISSAATTPLNLLIMETEKKERWANAFATFSMISGIGQITGLILSTLWIDVLPLIVVVFPLSLLSLSSAILASLMIKEPQFTFEREILVMNRRSFYERLLALPMIFLHIPKPSDFGRFFKSLRYELTRHMPILYLSAFVFYLASGIFNTSIVPALESNQVPGSAIFGITTIVMIVQTLSFRYAGTYVEEMSPTKAAFFGLLLRALGYWLIGISAYLLPSNWFVIPALLFWPLAAGFAFAIYYTASNIMVFHTLRLGNQGSSLGVYSALVGVATMTGSLISGFSSYYMGYSTTFTISAIGLLASAVLITRLRNV